MEEVYGAFRMYVKVLLMWDSKIQIDGGAKDVVLASMLEARNLVVLRFSSNADLMVYGQGLLNLSGPGDGIKARRLFLSLFYNIEVGPGSLVQAPHDEAVQSSLDALSRCESKTCPSELITPPDDCHVNRSLSFTLQICRVEDITVSGVVRGSIIHIHRARTVTIAKDGTISASELVNSGESHRGTTGNSNGTFKGGVGGGSGGSILLFLQGLLPDKNSSLSASGGNGGVYGGGGGGGGRIHFHWSNIATGDEYVQIASVNVIGSMKWPLSRLLIYGSVNSDGESHRGTTGNSNGTFKGGVGGGSGGSILLFLQGLLPDKNSSLSASGGNGGVYGGGGGGGGRIHFHWSNIATGDEYVQIASVNGCKEGIGKGTFLKYRAGGGAGHGGQGGVGIYNGMKSDGGLAYGNADLPCELGSGSGGSAVSADSTAGGGLIVIGSMKWPLSRLLIYGSVNSDGESHRGTTGNSNGTFKGGVGGGSGGSILLFLQGLLPDKNSSLSASGGNGGVYGGGGGGGGRIHFHWSNIATGDEYVQIASVNGTVASSGGSGNNDGRFGEDGTVTGKKCPMGIYGHFAPYGH
ncbi:hypothetical protein C2845_PM16G02960 [Panicum miliaceum]|uniref:Uncharacterized protein n=1 Tax=Panicum miliaceum TaxID=4540 RepID=A0A3L6PUQ6_PANMI|nr:hypothetical protein C2845_PM16G02960 [Panicum miliaceum]